MLKYKVYLGHLKVETRFPSRQSVQHNCPSVNTARKVWDGVAQQVSLHVLLLTRVGLPSIRPHLNRQLKQWLPVQY